MKFLSILLFISTAAFAADKPKPAPAKPVPGICRLDARNNKALQDAQKRAKCPAPAAPKKAAKKK